ncbi:MAG TPA: translation initiation factor IF-2 [Candidatus Azoamicus sp. OHIO2]
MTINNNLGITRTPIITVAGHIDHGKTTFLHYLSGIKNPQKEYGGITQRIQAYYVNTDYGIMTFLDTPGHFAFNSNRENCIKMSDIVLVIISAEDGIKPQTIETINTAKKFNIPIVVGISKIDKVLNVIDTEERILHELANYNLIPEKWGGDVIVMLLSSKTGYGVNNLIEMLKFQADILDLKIDNKDKPTGIVLENTIEVGKGSVTTLILKNGEFKKGDIVKVGYNSSKIRTIYDLSNTIIDVAIPSLPVNVTGIDIKFNIGDIFEIVDAENRKNKHDISVNKDRDINIYNVDSLIEDMKKSDIKKINLIVKVDVLGSVQVLKNLLENLSTSKIKIIIIKIEIGGFNESDIDLSLVTHSILLGFNIKIDSKIKKLVVGYGLKLYVFNVIYELLDFLKIKIVDELTLDKEIVILGVAEVKKLFKHKDHVIIGCSIISGKIRQNSNIKVKRENNVIYEGIIDSIKIHQTSVKEVRIGHECGISIKNFNKCKVADVIEAY